MATVNKDFKIKYGLIVEGTTATVNGYDVLTKKQDDQDYIVGLIGGTATSANTPNTVVKRDGSGNFAAGTITADITGQVSDISNHDTDDLSEGTLNLYYTNDRVKNVLTGSTQTNIQITEVGGVLHITAENGVADSTTDDLAEGTTNKYYTDGRVRLALSEGNGINYDNTTGTISADLGDFSTTDLTEGTNQYFTTQRARDSVSDGNGLTYNPFTGVFSASIGNGLEFGAGAEIQIDRGTVDGWYDASGLAQDVQDNLDDHTNATSAHGTTGSVVGTSDAQTLTNKTIGDILTFNDGSNDSTIDVDGNDLYVNANDNLTLSTATGDIVLNPNGSAYIGSASAGNEIATNGYVDNAVSGLTWKQSVNLLYDAAIPVLSGSGATQLAVDGHPVLGDADSGYRLLLTGTTSPGIYVYNSTGGSWTLTRSADADTYEELVGAAVYVMEGTQYGSTSWVQSNHYLSSFTGQSWTQFSGAGSVTAGSGITVDGLEVSVDRTTVDTWYDYNGAASDAIDAHDIASGVHGVSGNVVGTSDSQTLTNKTISGSNNTLSDIANASLVYDSITVNGYSTALGSSVTLGTDDVSEGSNNKYYLDSRARAALSEGTGINYNSSTGEITADLGDFSTSDLSEGTNKYFTDARVKDVLTGSTQSNISITNVAGELIITAENGVADSTTDDLDEGTYNHYFTDNRAKIAAADLLVNHSTKTNITITGDETGLTITAENGVADSTTDDLDEGSINLYFTDQRVLDAVNNSTITPTAVSINDYRKEEATQQYVATVSTTDVHSFGYPYESAKYLVRVVGWVGGIKHSQVSEILMTVDGNDNIAITEYGTIHTSDSPLASFSARLDQTGSTRYVLTATTAVAQTEIIAAATMLSWAD